MNIKDRQFLNTEGWGMIMVYLFLADGFEETEALSVVDILRRADVEVKTVSIMQRKTVTGAHSIEVLADMLFEEMTEKPEMLILPGGIPGTPNLKKHTGLDKLLRESVQSPEIYLVAICAAPTVYGSKGLFPKGCKATCYPGMEDELTGAEFVEENVVIDGRFITSRGVGTALEFGLALVSVLKGKHVSDVIAEKIVFQK